MTRRTLGAEAEVGTRAYAYQCGSCRFAKISVVKGYDALTCHRYAPRPLNGGVGTGESPWEWPVVAVNESCGEYEYYRHEEARDGE